MAETTQSTKPKVAFYWCASCGGCEEAVVDLAEKILDVVGAVDIVFWPVALDFKRRDVEAMADGSLAAAFLNWLSLAFHYDGFSRGVVDTRDLAYYLSATVLFLYLAAWGLTRRKWS